MRVELLVALLVFLAVLCIGGAYVVLRTGRRQAVLDRLKSKTPEPHDAPGQPQSWLTRLLQSLGVAVSPGGGSATLREQLAMAGHFERSAPAIYMGAKVIFLAIGMIAPAFFLTHLPLPLPIKVLILLICGAALFFLPNLALRARIRARTTQVRQHLPDAIDLLEICVSAGMGLDMAWNAVTDEVRRLSPVLADEMLLTNLELHLGATRAHAMRHMSQRTGADEIASLSAMLIQADRFGTSIADALRIFAVSMRDTRAQRAEEAAEKMAVKLLVPMVLFVFPTMLIVTAGPAAITAVAVLAR